MLRKNNTVLVTGGCGFIGSAVVRYLLTETDARVVNVDKLTYAGHEASVAPVADAPRYTFAPTNFIGASGAGVSPVAGLFHVPRRS